MQYEVVVTKTAKKDILKLSSQIQKRLKEKIIYFTTASDPLIYATKLVGEQSGLYRWRVGDYRVVFQIDENVIQILKVQHRREVYRK